MSTSWFNIGVRFLSGDMARGMRAAGQNFHSMIEGQRQDLKSLGTELNNLEKKEQLARKNLKDEVRDQKQRVAEAQRNLSAQKGRISLTNAEVDALKASNKALGNDPAWVAWNQRIRDVGKGIAATRMELTRLADIQRKLDKQTNANHATGIHNLKARKIHETQVRDDAIQHLRDLQRAAPKGAARRDASVRAGVADLQAGVDSATDRRVVLADQAKALNAKLKGLGLEQTEINKLARAQALATRQERRKEHRAARQAIVQEGLDLAKARLGVSAKADEVASLNASARSAKAAVRRMSGVWSRVLRARDRTLSQIDPSTPNAATLRGAVNVRYAPLADQLESATRKKRRIAQYKGTEADYTTGDARATRARIQHAALAIATRRAGLQPYDSQVVEGAGVAARRAAIAAQVNDVLAQQAEVQGKSRTARDQARAGRRALRIVDRMAPSAEAVSSDAAIAAQQRQVDTHRGQVRDTSRSILTAEQALTKELAANKAVLANQTDAQLTESARLKGVHAAESQNEPKRNSVQVAANNAAIATKTAEVAGLKSGLPGLIQKVQQAVGITPDARPLEQATAARAAKQADFEVKRAEHQATRQHVQALRETRTQIKQQLWGSVFDLTSKFYMLSRAIGRLRNVMSAAALFQFRSRGLSTLLGGGRGEGADVYGTYARSAAYQSEVSPTAAIGRMRELAAAGYSRAEIPKATESIYNTMLASQGEVSESGAFDLGISLQKAFGTRGQDMGSLLDTVVAASNKLPMTVGKIREAMGYATEASVQTGQSLEETLLGIGLIMPITKTASKAGTIFRNATLSMAKPKGQEILANLGVTPKDETGNNRPVLDVFADIRRALLEVEKKDMAGTWEAPYGKKRSKKEQDIARGEAISRLNMKREEIEFAFTGQRGGAIFAALERLPELAKSTLRGGIYEGAGYRFKDVDDALKAMRLGLLDTAGESRRMADELRKTSQMLGVSFGVSIEKFKISFGTFLLPVRDAFTNVAKTILDNVTSWMNGGTDQNYGQPGGRPVGSSLGMNLLGSGVMFGTVVLGMKTLMTVFRTFGTAKLLFQPAAIEATLAALRGGMGMPEAMRTGGLVMAQSAGGFSAKVGMLASTVAGVLGPIALVGGAMWAITTALDAARNAVVDFTHVTEAATVRRNTKFFGGLQAVFAGVAEGKIRQDPKTGEWIAPEADRKALLGGDRYTGAAVKGLLSGRDPLEVLNDLKTMRRDEIERQYASSSQVVRDEKLKLFDEEFQQRKEEFFGMTSEDILRRRRKEYGDAGMPPDDPRMIRLESMIANALRDRGQGEAATGEIFNMEKGGKDKTVLLQLMKESGTTNVRDAVAWLTSGGILAGSGRTGQLTSDIFAERYARQNPDAGWLGKAGGFLGQFGSYMSGAYLGAVGMPDLGLDKDDLDIQRSDFNAKDQYVKGMPGALVYNPATVQADIATATDAQLRSAGWLEKINAELAKLPDALARRIAEVSPGLPSHNPQFGGTPANPFVGPTYEVP